MDPLCLSDVSEQGMHRFRHSSDHLQWIYYFSVTFLRKGSTMSQKLLSATHQPWSQKVSRFICVPDKRRMRTDAWHGCLVRMRACSTKLRTCRIFQDTLCVHTDTVHSVVLYCLIVIDRDECPEKPENGLPDLEDTTDPPCGSFGIFQRLIFTQTDCSPSHRSAHADE